MQIFKKEVLDRVEGVLRKASEAFTSGANAVGDAKDKAAAELTAVKNKLTAAQADVDRLQLAFDEVKRKVGWCVNSTLCCMSTLAFDLAVHREGKIV